MFGFQKHDDSSYSGDSCYKYVEPLLNRRGGSLRIISPYISAGYARMLLDIAKMKKVNVITSGGTGIEDSEAVGLLRKGRKGYSAAQLLLLPMVALGLYAFSFYLYAILSAALAALLIWLAYNRNSRNRSNLCVKVVTDRFIHEKLYLTEDTAITGSANLTFSGMHRNIEHIDVIRDSGKVRSLLDHFDELWSKY
jgi:phosphatidylserine/phosphatidylglycerophosphate/cardiolipin synthase-like enzyme